MKRNNNAFVKNRVPRIGFVGYFIKAEEGIGGKFRGLPEQDFLLYSYDNVDPILQVGAVPVALPIVPEEHIEAQLASVDAVVFTGGEDLNPHHFQNKWEIGVERTSGVRDSYENKLLELSLLSQRPILCICRGMQLLNAHLGGTLFTNIADIGNNVDEHWRTDLPRWEFVHSVNLKKGHFVESVFGRANLEVNSIHHQAVNMLGKGLEVVGESTDGIVEAISLVNNDNVLAVQWHPEMIAQKNPDGLKPYYWLVKKVQQQLD